MQEARHSIRPEIRDCRPFPAENPGRTGAALAAGLTFWHGGPSQEQPLVVPQSSQTTQVPFRLTRTDPQEEQLSPA